MNAKHQSKKAADLTSRQGEAWRGVARLVAAKAETATCPVVLYRQVVAALPQGAGTNSGVYAAPLAALWGAVEDGVSLFGLKEAFRRATPK